MRKSAGENKFKKVLHEAKAGTLRTSAGGKPKSRKQELAIAFSEARRVSPGYGKKRRGK